MSTTNQAYVEAVLAKCTSLKAARLWPPEPAIRPRAWLRNFDDRDRSAAAVLLDNFLFFSEHAKLRLLVSSFDAACRIPQTSTRWLSQQFVREALFTPVLGQTNNLTDSGFTIGRAVRQHLSVSEDRFVSLREAFLSAESGKPVVFLDDVTITGDQFMQMWEATDDGESFASLARRKSFEAACFYILATSDARSRIETLAAPVKVYAAHYSDLSQTYYAMAMRQPPPLIPDAFAKVDELLDRFAPQLRFRPDDDYMTQDPAWAKLGYKERALMIGFENNVPDGTLPLFWADGPTAQWTPLVRRA